MNNKDPLRLRRVEKTRPFPVKAKGDISMCIVGFGGTEQPWVLSIGEGRAISDRSSPADD